MDNTAYQIFPAHWTIYFSVIVINFEYIWHVVLVVFFFAEHEMADEIFIALI